MRFGLVEGFRVVRRSWGLVSLLLVVNLCFAASLAAPLAATLEREFDGTDASVTMLHGFDFSWWQEWSDRQSGWQASFRPDLFGMGFAVKNLSLLLRGELPGGLLTRPGSRQSDDNGDPGLDGVILGLGLAYLILQTFLLGGVLGVLRAPRGDWTLRSLLHGSGFYFARLLRVALLALASLSLVFVVNAPFARWVDGLAREAVSGTSATTLGLARHLLLLLAILFVAMISSYAKVIVVLEERSSAVLAFVSSLGFCLRHFWWTAGHYLLLTLAPIALVLAWSGLDSHWVPTGYRTQLVSLVLAQGLIFGKIWLRLALLGGQVSIFRRRLGRTH